MTHLFAKCPQLWELDLGGSDIGDGPPIQVLHFPAQLELAYNCLLDTGFRDFLENDAIARIEDLDLSNCDITEKGRAKIEGSRLRPFRLLMND